MKKVEVIENDTVEMKKAFDIQSICIKKTRKNDKETDNQYKYFEEEIYRC